jgi:hypothetical protein
LTVSVNENWVTAALVHSIYPGDEGRCLTLTDADDVGLVTRTTGADVDVVIASLDRISTAKTQCNVGVTSSVAIERPKTDSSIAAAG